jgi:hypothetical protein
MKRSLNPYSKPLTREKRSKGESLREEILFVTPKSLTFPPPVLSVSLITQGRNEGMHGCFQKPSIFQQVTLPPTQMRLPENMPETLSECLSHFTEPGCDARAGWKVTPCGNPRNHCNSGLRLALEPYDQVPVVSQCLGPSSPHSPALALVQPLSSRTQSAGGLDLRRKNWALGTQGVVPPDWQHPHHQEELGRNAKPQAPPRPTDSGNAGGTVASSLFKIQPPKQITKLKRAITGHGGTCL